MDHDALPYPWKYFDDMVRIARSILRDHDAARDVAVTTCEQLVGKPERPKSEVVRRASWRARDLLRKRIKTPEHNAECDIPDTEDDDLTAEKALEIAQAIEELDLRDQAVIMVQAEMDVPDKEAVKRAKSALKKKLREQSTTPD